MQVHSSTENTSETVRRVLAHALGVPRSTLTDEFVWIKEVTVEDAGWVLAAVQGAFNTELFDDFVSKETMDRISTVHGLVLEVKNRLGQSRANC